MYEIEAFCNICIEDYTKAINIYKSKKMFFEVGEIYFNYIKDYDKAFDYYSKANKHSKAIESLIKSSKIDRMVKLFEYINNQDICIQIWLSEYFNCYKDNINQLFNLASVPKRINTYFFKVEIII